MPAEFNSSLSLTNNLLIAMPCLNNTFFANSVILLCEHNHNGAMGVIINLPLELGVAEILDEMDIEVDPNSFPELDKMPVLQGGPVKPEQGFVLHYNNGHIWNSSLEISKDLIITTSDDIVFALANNKDKNHASISEFLFILGYCEWQAGQLEKELAENSWLTIPADLETVFKIDPDFKWRECIYTLGIDEIHNLSIHGGHA